MLVTRLRSLVVLVRPPVLLLLVLYGALGLARHGLVEDHLAGLRVALVAAGTLLFAVAANDLSDVAVDRVNLPGDRRRPLASGLVGRGDVVAADAAGAVAALAAAAWTGRVALTVVAVGLGLSAIYSLPPFRLSARGIVAPLVLPACYVAVPFLLGLLQSGRPVAASDLLLLLALYVGFVGRIVLKDFRDLRGDTLFGKRTFLVRHGRRATCATSAVFWTAGAVLLAVTVRPSGTAYVGLLAAATGGALVLIRALARSRHHRTDERLISAIAVVGRSTLLVTLLQLGLPREPWAPWLVLALGLVLAGQAVTMARSGPQDPSTGSAHREWVSLCPSRVTVTLTADAGTGAGACGDSSIERWRE